MSDTDITREIARQSDAMRRWALISLNSDMAIVVVRDKFTNRFRKHSEIPKSEASVETAHALHEQLGADVMIHCDGDTYVAGGGIRLNLT